MLSLDEIVAGLTEIVGARCVSTNPIDKVNYQHTLAYGAYRALPDVIVRVESDSEGQHKVAEILRFANQHKIPIVAKGGVGMGISSSLKGGLLLDMLGMDKVLEVNPTMQYVIAEGGASVYAIHGALRKHGLMLPNFGTYGPAVVIGAMINKGGIGYGMTRYGWIADMVLGLEVILANGEVIRLGALANQGTAFGPFQRWIHLPDLLGLFTLAAGSMLALSWTSGGCSRLFVSLRFGHWASATPATTRTRKRAASPGRRSVGESIWAGPLVTAAGLAWGPASPVCPVSS